MEKNTPKRPGAFHNWLSLAGFIISAGGVFAFILLFAIDTFAHNGNPYMGLLAYVVAPAFMLLGLAIAFFGAWLHRKRLVKAGIHPDHPAISIDLTRKRDRHVLAGVI